MKRLVEGESYKFLIFELIAISIVLSVPFALFFGPQYFAFGFLATMYYLAIIQIYSGVALSRRWVAEYSKGDHPLMFYLVITVNIFAPTWLLYHLLSFWG